MRILILEDDPFIAFDLQAILEGHGHQVVGLCGNLNEARRHLEDGVDYALLDIDIGGNKSYNLAAQLAERQVPFAFVSASNPGDVPQLLRAASFIAKPFEEREILRYLEKTS